MMAHSREKQFLLTMGIMVALAIPILILGNLLKSRKSESNLPLPTPSPRSLQLSPTPLPENPANLKTYQNPKIGFEIQHPPEWKTAERESEVVWYSKEPSGASDPYALRVFFYGSDALDDSSPRCDKAETCFKVSQITTQDGALTISIWQPNDQLRQEMNLPPKHLFAFLDETGRPVVPEFSTNLLPVYFLGQILSTFKFLGEVTPTPVPVGEPEACVQVVTPAKNPATGECQEFPTPCDVPEGWEKVEKCF